MDPEHTGNVHWLVPRSVNSLFTGRAELLARAQKAFRVNQGTKNQEQKRLVITGLGGQGKSEVSLKIANLMQEEYVLPNYSCHMLMQTTDF